MKAVVLAAGEGSRLKPFTATRPKVMIPVGNKPILEYVVNALHASGIVDIIMVVGYKKEKIMDYFGDGRLWGVNITYVEQFPQLGTAHALRQASYLINDHFLTVNGDTIIDSSAIKELMRYRVGDAAMLTVNVDMAQKYGVVKTQNDLVKNILEKPKNGDMGNTVNAGVYRFSPRIFDFLEFMDISERGDYEITDAIRHMISDDYSVRAVHTGGMWMDAMYPADILDLNAAMISREKAEIKGTLEHDAHVQGPVSVGANSIIRSGCYIMGPVVIGDNCDIGPNAVILPCTSIGSNVTVEPFTRISDSVVMNNVKISSFGFLSRTIIGEGTTIGPGFTAEAGKARVETEDHMMDANVGAIVGDNTDISGNVLTKPGCVVGIRCKVGSGTVIRNYIPDNTKVI